MKTRERLVVVEWWNAFACLLCIIWFLFLFFPFRRMQ
jgi:hypothetical protein